MMRLGLLLLILMQLSACGINFSPLGPNTSSIKGNDGKALLNCDGHALYGDGLNRFLKKNNIPKGTTDFVCKDGKAYLPDQVPRD